MHGETGGCRPHVPLAVDPSRAAPISGWILAIYAEHNNCDCIHDHVADHISRLQRNLLGLSSGLVPGDVGRILAEGAVSGRRGWWCLPGCA